jgi:predicted phage baseplate assembly protein
LKPSQKFGSQEKRMTLPAPNLDDLRFQRDLVDEARKRIIHYCPEWTEYNLSDPGITLIELFAWMTEMMVYRLNRVPEKNYIKFLEMLGLQRRPASSARTDLTFWLSIPLPFNPGDEQTVVIPAGLEVRSEMSGEEILFTTERADEVVPPLLAHVRKEGEFNKNYYPRLKMEPFLPFNSEVPQIGDTFYLGFQPQNDISGHILRLDFAAEPTEAVGIRRDDPPWLWECLTTEGEWVRLAPSMMEGERDTTGGMNNENGHLVLYLPLNVAPASLHGLNAFWLRCRIYQRDPLQGMYTESPRLRNIESFSLGVTIPAMHSVNISGEVLGSSNGEPGQYFRLQRSPVLNLQPGETVEVEEIREGELVFVPWTQVNNFAQSSRFDRHFVLDMAEGVVHFGPAVRQPDGTVVQYGRIPESGRAARFSRYRCGGGVQGNMPAGSINTLMSSLAYVSRVSNLVRAVGGRDQETLDELKARAQRELQAQRRAVTAQDFEQFTLSYSGTVQRARCLTPGNQPEENNSGSGGAVNILVVPAVADALKNSVTAALHLDEKFRSELRQHLDQYRLMTVSLHIREPQYIGVKVKARIVPHDYHQPAVVQERVVSELQRYLTPLPLDDQPPLLRTGEDWEGWPFGRDLFAAEIISLIQQIPLVKYVLDVEISSRLVVPLIEKRAYDDAEAPALTPVEKVLLVPDDGLLCSLEHEIELVSVEEIYGQGGKR